MPRTPPTGPRLAPTVARFVALAAVALPLGAAAQPAPRLPSLTPGVFESRGAAPRVSLPDLERQPLTGFGPPPRSFVIPAEREPVTQPFAPDLDALPALALQPPPAPASDLPTAHRFRAEAGGGAQYARYGRLDLVTAGVGGRFFVDAAYDGLDRADRRAYVASDRLDVRAGGQSFATGRMRIEAAISYGTYDLLAANTFARRQRSLFGGEWGIEGVGAVPYALSVGYTQSSLGLTDGTDQGAEGRVDAAGHLALAQGLLRLDASGGAAGDGGVGTDVRYGSGGVAVALGRPDGARLTLGVRALAYDATAVQGGGDSRTLGPIVEVHLPLGDALWIFGTNDPHLEVRSLAALAALNPYVTADPVVAPDVRPVDAQAGLALNVGAAQARAYVLGLYAPTYLVFEPGGNGLFIEDYVDARAAGIGGDLTVAAPRGVSASAGLELRQGSISGGGDLPFYAPLVVRAGVQTRFARGRGRVGLAAYGEGPRKADRFGATASAWGTLGLDARYDLSGPFALTARAERLIGSAERWPGYPDAPYAVMLGLRLTR